MATEVINPTEIGKLAETQDVVVDFWAAWCGPCRAFGPVFEELSNEYPNVKFIKVNIDDYPEFAADNAIGSIPTLWVYRDGEKTYNRPGSLLPEQLRELLA